MNDTLARLQSHRSWYVPNVDVVGEIEAYPIDAIAAQWDGGTPRVVYHRFTLGGEAQTIDYTSLVDHRGASLPATLESPLVVPIAKGGIDVAILGTPTSSNFRIAKTETTSEAGVVDLLIVEMRD